MELYRLVCLVTWGAVLCIAVVPSAPTPVANRGSTNVLFIVVDNLRPALGAYGNKEVQTPRIDALAANSTLFSRAFCQEAWCSPSRNSFLTGRAPDETKAYNFRDSFRQSASGQPGPGADWTTLPGYFLQHGYYASSSGKVFHPELPANFDFPHSWSDQPILQDKASCRGARPACNGTQPNCETMGCPFAPPARNADSDCAELLISRLGAWKAKASRPPFFLAAGFQGPRLPWSYPASVAAARYPQGSTKLSVAKLQDSPRGEFLEWFRPVEIDQYADVHVTHDKPMSTASQQRVRLAYYAAITNVDDQVGRLLDAVEAAGADVYGRTAVVFTSDHAQNLGEANMWSMMNLLETSLRVPLLIKPAPLDARFALPHAGLPPIYPHPVELLDLMPTVAGLASLPAPPAAWKLLGTDLTPALVRSGTRGTVLKPLNAAFSQITRCLNCTLAYTSAADNEITGCVADAVDARWYVPCALTPRQDFDWMGMSVRTATWRYSLFCRWNGAELKANWSSCEQVELYNHTHDTAIYDVDNNGEPFNLAGQPAVATLERQLRGLLERRFNPSVSGSSR